jgi:hypothetical protein
VTTSEAEPAFPIRATSRDSIVRLAEAFRSCGGRAEQIRRSSSIDLWHMTPSVVDRHRHNV